MVEHLSDELAARIDNSDFRGGGMIQVLFHNDIIKMNGDARVPGLSVDIERLALGIGKIYPRNTWATFNSDGMVRKHENHARLELMTLLPGLHSPRTLKVATRVLGKIYWNPETAGDDVCKITEQVLVAKRIPGRWE